MKANTRLVLVLFLAALGIGCKRVRSNLDASSHREGTGSTEFIEPTASADSTPIARAPDLGTGDRDSSEPLPVIDFPLLDQVRSLDLIDSKLDFPESLKKLEGRRVSMVGFMTPFDSLDNMRRCMIVPSYVGCTFCNPPNLTQVVYVIQGSEDGSARPYPFIEEASHVSGTLRLSLPGSDHEGQQQGFVYSIENAVTTPHTGDAPQRAPGHGSAVSGQPVHKQGATPVDWVTLVTEVADLLGREPLRPIEIERVSTKSFGDLVRNGWKATFSETTLVARTRAFNLLGMLPEDADWIDTLAGFQLARRVAATNETGDRIHLLDSVADDHPYVRLELVGEIADALVRQHFPPNRPGTRGDESEVTSEWNDDARRAHEALRQGIRTMALYRYARSFGISPTVEPPAELVPQEGEEGTFASIEFDLWQSLPSDIGSFFVDFLVGAAGPLSGVDSALANPPSTTMEFFRPRWYQDATLWRQNLVPSDFADTLLEIKPTLTDVLGVGGLVPWLARWYPVDAAKGLAGRWAGDRWAVWRFADGAWALMLEIRFQDEDSAIQFREAIPDEPLQTIPSYETGSLTVRLLRADSATALADLARAVQAAKPLP